MKGTNTTTAIKKISTSTIILIGFLILLLALDFLFIIMVQNEARTIVLLKKELSILEEDAQVIDRSKELITSYEEEIATLSTVFPTEETIPTFIQVVEELTRQNATEYNFKFNSVTPVSQQGYLYLPMTIILKTDFPKLTQFLDELEKMPYMTHITSIITKSPDGFVRSNEVTIVLTVYVKDPFTNQ